MSLAMLMSIGAIVTGIILLVWSADRFVDGASSLARNLGVSPLLVGMLIIGFGTSAPELLVSSVAAFEGNPGLGIGNALGSNITNIALVLGATAIFVNLPVHSRIVKKELLIVLGAVCLAGYLMWDDKAFSRSDGLILLGLLFVILGTMTYLSLKDKKEPLPTQASDDLSHPPLSLKRSIFWTVLGLVILVGSSKLLVFGATDIAHALGVSDLIIGLTIVAIGTSLPELAASITSATRGETDLAVGNVVGSNLFNTLGVLALPGIIGTASIPEGVLERDFPVTIGLTALLIVFWILCRGSYKITRGKGILLLSLFVAYEGMLYYQSVH